MDKKTRRLKRIVSLFSMIFLLLSTSIIVVSGQEQEEQEYDFYVDLPEYVEVSQGEYALVEIGVYAVEAYEWPVYVSAILVPQGISIEFEPESVVPPGVVVLNVSACPEAETGDFIIIIEAQGLDPNFMKHTHTIPLKVKEKVVEKYDLIAWYLNPIQVVKTGYDYLVLGKNTVFEVGIYSSFPHTVFATIMLVFDGFDTQEYVTDPLPLKPKTTTYYILPLEEDLPIEYWLRFELRKAPKPIGKPAGVYVEVDPDNRVEEIDDVFNNRFPDEDFQEYPVLDTNPLTILYRPAPIFPGDDWTSLAGMLDSFATHSTEFILGTYPIADKEIKCFVDPTWTTTRIRVSESFYDDYLEDFFPSNVTGLVYEEDDEVVIDLTVAEQNGVLSATTNATLEALYRILRPYSFTAFQSAADEDCFYRIVLVTPPGWFGRHFHSSYATVTGLMFTSLLGAVFSDVGSIKTPAHEIGHTFFLWTNGTEEYDLVDPGYKAYGFWVNKYTEIDDSCRHDLQLDHEVHPGYCFMGLASNETKEGVPFRGSLMSWICTFDYRRLQDTYCPYDPELLLVDGIIFEDGEVILHSFYRMPNSVTSMPMGTVGNYYIVLLGSEGQVLGQVGFNATFQMQVEPASTCYPMDTDFQPFMFTILWIDGTTQIQIRNKEGSVLASRTVSLNPPQVVVKTPNGGEDVYTEGTYKIEWTATDPDGDAPTFTILYSPDNGETWHPLAMDLTGTQFEWNPTDMPPGEQYLIRIIASDGVNSVDVTSDAAFTVVEGAPPPPLPMTTIIIVVVAVAAIALIALYFKKKRKG